MRKKKRKSSIISTIILILILLVGLSVMLYPTISDWWNSKHQSRAIANYDKIVEEMDEDQTGELLAQAYEYNNALSSLQSPMSQYEQIQNYEDVLNISGTGIIGYIDIPTINVHLPIYHGTSEGVLNIAAGHLEGSTLPVGGIGTHAVISAHRGLPSAKLFSDLDQIYVGDTFTITVLNEVLTYEVEEIRIVLPHEIENLAIEKDKDLVTLMTCTPYGINSHRLLIRSHRIETIFPANVRVTADAVLMDSLKVVPYIAAPFLLALLIFWTISSHRRKCRIPWDNPLSIFDDNKAKSKKDGDS